jgi:hypothetical protein
LAVVANSAIQDTLEKPVEWTGIELYTPAAQSRTKFDVDASRSILKCAFYVDISMLNFLTNLGRICLVLLEQCRSF